MLYDIPVQRTTPSAQPPIKAFSTSATKKDPHPFWSGRFFIAQKAFWKNQVEGALKRKKGRFENGIGMLYLEQMHENAQNRTNEREQAQSHRPSRAREPPQATQDGKRANGTQTHGRAENTAHNPQRTPQTGQHI